MLVPSEELAELLEKVVDVRVTLELAEMYSPAPDLALFEVIVPWLREEEIDTEDGIERNSVKYKETNI